MFAVLEANSMLGADTQLGSLISRKAERRKCVQR